MSVLPFEKYQESQVNTHMSTHTHLMKSVQPTSTHHNQEARTRAFRERVRFLIA